MFKKILISVATLTMITSCLKIKDSSASTAPVSSYTSPQTDEKQYKQIFRTVVAYDQKAYLSNLGVQKSSIDSAKKNELKLDTKVRSNHIVDIRFNAYSMALDNTSVSVNNNLSNECKDRENFTNRCKWHLFTRIVTRSYSGITYSPANPVAVNDLKFVSNGILIKFEHPDGQNVTCSLEDLESNTSVFNAAFKIENKPKCLIFPDANSEGDELQLTVINKIEYPTSLQQVGDGLPFQEQIAYHQVDSEPPADLSEHGTHHINSIPREFLIQPIITFQYTEKVKIK